MSLPYVKLERDEALALRKNVLETEMTFLNMAKTITEFKKLRQIGSLRRTRLKRAIRQAKIKSSLMLKELPQIESIKLDETLKETTYEAKEIGRIESELEDIKSKLGKLQ